MNTYRAYFAANLRLKSEKLLTFDFSDARVCLVPPQEIREDYPFEEQEWMVIGECRAAELDTATDYCRNYAELVLNMMALVHKTPVGVCRKVIAYCVEPQTDTRPWKQWFRTSDELPLRRKFKEVEFTNVWQHTMELPEEHRERLSRALQLYRAGVLERLDVPRFALLYIGLEAINRTIQRMFGLKVREMEPCPCCGHERVKHTNTGIKYVITNILGEDIAIWRELTTVRAKLFHSAQCVDDLMPRLHEMLPVVERALHDGILAAVGIGSPAASAHKEPLPVPEQLEIFLEGHISDLDEAPPDIARLPAWLAAKTLSLPRHETKEGNVKFPLSFESTAVCDPQSCRLTVTGWGLKGSVDPEAEVEVTHLD